MSIPPKKCVPFRKLKTIEHFHCRHEVIALTCMILLHFFICDNIYIYIYLYTSKVLKIGMDQIIKCQKKKWLFPLLFWKKNTLPKNDRKKAATKYLYNLSLLKPVFFIK